MRSNGTDRPERVKVRAPTLANLASITNMIEGGYLADVPIVIAAIDPCFSCTDRMIRVQDAAAASSSALTGRAFGSTASTGTGGRAWICHA